MKSFIRIFIILLVIIISFNTALFAKPKNDYLNIQTWKTKSGVPVYFIREKKLPIIDIEIIFHAGSAYDGKHYGLSSLTSSMIGRTTYSQSENEIIDQINDLGTDINTYNNRDSLIISFRSLSTEQFLKPSLKLYQDILTQSKFDSRIFKRVKNQYLTSLQLDEQSPTTIAYKRFYRTLYGKHPYGHPINGTIKSINNIQIKDIENFYQQYIVAQNGIITIVGNISKNKAQQISDRLTEKIPQGTYAGDIPKPATPIKDKNISIPFPSQQTTVLIGTLGIQKGSPMFFPLTVGNQILGGSGLTSLLFNEVRKKRGLAYGAYSEFNTFQQNGTFIISTKTRNKKVPQTIQVIQNVLKKFIEKGPISTQINSAKKYIIGSFPLSFASNESKSNMLGLIGFYQLPLNYLNTYTENINKVTRQQINRDFHAILKAQKLITVTVGGSINIENKEQHKKSLQENEKPNP